MASPRTSTSSNSSSASAPPLRTNQHPFAHSRPPLPPLYRKNAPASRPPTSGSTSSGASCASVPSFGRSSTSTSSARSFASSGPATPPLLLEHEGLARGGTVKGKAPGIGPGKAGLSSDPGLRPNWLSRTRSSNLSLDLSSPRPSFESFIPFPSPSDRRDRDSPSAPKYRRSTPPCSSSSSTPSTSAKPFAVAAASLIRPHPLRTHSDIPPSTAPLHAHASQLTRVHTGVPKSHEINPFDYAFASHLGDAPSPDVTFQGWILQPLHTPASSPKLKKPDAPILRVDPPEPGSSSPPKLPKRPAQPENLHPPPLPRRSSAGKRREQAEEAVGEARGGAVGRGEAIMAARIKAMMLERRALSDARPASDPPSPLPRSTSTTGAKCRIPSAAGFVARGNDAPPPGPGDAAPSSSSSATKKRQGGGRLPSAAAIAANFDVEVGTSSYSAISVAATAMASRAVTTGSLPTMAAMAPAPPGGRGTGRKASGTDEVPSRSGRSPSSSLARGGFRLDVADPEGLRRRDPTAFLEMCRRNSHQDCP